MIALLRYNGRNTVYFERGKWPALNPITSRSHDPWGGRTYRLDEPLWLMRLRNRLFCFAGRQRCPSRDGNPSWSDRFNGKEALPDTWDRGPDGNRTCSYCGSAHADDMLAIAMKALADERYAIEGTQKSYKVYLKQPGVRNAGEGAIKFYMWHAPAQPRPQDEATFSLAMKLTHDRFMAKYGPKTGAVA